MSGGKIPRHETPGYHKARALAEELDDKGLAATIDMLRTMLAAYGDVQVSRRRKVDPAKLAAAYQALVEREMSMGAQKAPKDLKRKGSF